MNLIRRAILAIALIAGLGPAFAQVPPPVPALPDSERRISYSITGTTCACNVNFALYGDSTDYQNWVEVYLNGVPVTFNDPTFGWTITSPTGPLSTIPRPVTDAVLTFNAVQTGTVQIVGARRPRRTSQFSENRGVAARDLNQAVTDITATLREMWDKTNDVTGRGLFSQPGVDLGLLPLPSACQGKFLGFDATGLIPQCSSGGAGSGNVVGPVSSTVGHFAIFNNTTGNGIADHVIQGSDLPNPSASTLGGVQSFTCSSHNWFNTLSTGGVFGCSQPNFTDLAGSIAASQIPNSTLTNAMHANMAAWTIKMNNTSGSAAPTDTTIDGLTLKSVPVSTDEIPIWDVAAGAMKKATVLSVAAANNYTMSVQTFTASGTYTPVANLVVVDVECVGSGGAGGGTPVTGASQTAAGGGGGAGGYTRGLFTAATIGGSQVVTIGSAGVAGSGASGGAGNTVTFGALLTANGGAGGPVGVSQAVSTIAGGAAGGTASGGYLNAGGQTGYDGWGSSGATLSQGGAGGQSVFGNGGTTAMVGSSGSINGVPAAGFGSGGGGGAAAASAGQSSGGAGSKGVCIMHEFHT